MVALIFIAEFYGSASDPATPPDRIPGPPSRLYTREKRLHLVVTGDIADKAFRTHP
jgi:hypothetical protein